jgi:hypothetical protein
MAPKKIVKARKQIVWEIAKSGMPPSAKHTSLKYFAEQERGDNIMTWQNLTIFNWGTFDPKIVNLYLHDLVGCTHLTKDKQNFIFWGDETQEKVCELHKIAEKGGTGFIWIPEYSTEEKDCDILNTIIVEVPKLEVPPPAKCIVKFLPPSGWIGNFGFDWMREGLSTIIGDSDYKGIVGKYFDKDPDWGDKWDPVQNMMIYPNTAWYNALKNTYVPFSIPEIKNTDGSDYENFTSWLSLFPEDECKNKLNSADIKVKIDVLEGVPKSINLECEMANFKDYIDISKEVLPTSSCEDNLTIKFKKACPDDIIINAVNHTNDDKGLNFKRSVGRLILLKNDKANRYQANVIFIPVLTNINGIPNQPSILDLEIEKNYLEKYLSQSLTSVAFKTIHTIESEIIILQRMEKSPLSLNLDLQLKYPEKNAHLVIKNPLGKNVISYYIPGLGGSKIHTYLETTFNSEYPEYSDWYKVFFFEEEGGYYEGAKYNPLNGAARDIPSKSVVVYKGHTKETTTHELLHAMGLFHSFSNRGNFTYEKGETENIMDYSHQIVYGSKTRLSTWKWQWEELKNKLTKEA